MTLQSIKILAVPILFGYAHLFGYIGIGMDLVERVAPTGGMSVPLFVRKLYRIEQDCLILLC